ncbi:hypothetical protein P167DRAFT_79261 [Morchella conica CCBAS932]|uniref:Cytochrome P450 n=1 Tax=Morchella conica CCBAS932 TaxID=1392247 RepID=A0A3N4KUE0_9PEZI|nr:hypothetical protein P167DRAFT_79261 [Morchella conica CCBAS932]
MAVHVLGVHLKYRDALDFVWEPPMATKKQPMNFGLGPEICMGEKSTKTLHIYSLKNLNISLKIQKNNQIIALALAITLIAILNFQTCFSWSLERASVEKRG